MNKTICVLAAAVFSFSSVAAQAGGFGSKKSNSLINVSPSIDLGKLNVLNGNSVLDGLDGAAILSGNNISGILNGNKTGVANGVLSGILSGNSYKVQKRH